MTGYVDCACRDCFDVAIGEDNAGALCLDCEEYGCDATGATECASPYAYGQEEDHEDHG